MTEVRVNRQTTSYVYTEDEVTVNVRNSKTSTATVYTQEENEATIRMNTNPPNTLRVYS